MPKEFSEPKVRREPEPTQSPMLAQIEADGGETGARVRKNSVRSTPVAPKVKRERAVPQTGAAAGRCKVTGELIDPESVTPDSSGDGQ